MEYRVLTNTSILDLIDSEDARLALVDEWETILLEYGYKFIDTQYPVQFGNGVVKVQTIDESLQCLSMKEGADLVEFEDGSVGFVGYYGDRPTDTNNFKLMKAVVELDNTTSYNFGIIEAYCTEDLKAFYQVAEKDVEEAQDIMEKAMADWFTWAEYSQVCFGTLIEDRLDCEGIKYTEL